VDEATLKLFYQQSFGIGMEGTVGANRRKTGQDADLRTFA